jgi:pimeloyl-ACP methyl ester carboxylesterase
LQFAVYDEVAAQCRVRLIAPDRPGYGHSSYQAGRRLTDWPIDTAALADHLGVERFGVIGHSCGGPHALACARFLPDRVFGCGVLSGVASQAEGPMTEGMMASNRVQTAVYRHWPRSLDPVAVALWQLSRPLVAPALAHGRHHPEAGLDRMQKMLPACDAAVMARPEIRSELLMEVESFSNVVLRTSVQDMAMAFRDWGFSLEDINVPTQIWQGTLDRNVPPSHAYFQANRIPDARLHICPDEGHWLLADHMQEVLSALIQN